MSRVGVSMPPPPPPWRRRAVAAAILAGSLGLLLTGHALQPADGGVGTHTQLGLPACGFHEYVRLPCATCGMTTAVSLAAHGQLVKAFMVQPAGAALALGAAMLAWISGYAMWRGLDVLALFRPLWRPTSLAAVGTAILAAWAFRIMMTLGAH